MARSPRGSPGAVASVKTGAEDTATRQWYGPCQDPHGTGGIPKDSRWKRGMHVESLERIWFYIVLPWKKSSSWVLGLWFHVSFKDCSSPLTAGARWIVAEYHTYIWNTPPVKKSDGEPGSLRILCIYIQYIVKYTPIKNMYNYIPTYIHTSTYVCI